MQLEDRIAIITGARQGIGYGIAETLAHEGAQVMIGELIPERGLEAAARLRADGWQAESMALDVTDTAACKSLVDHVRKAYGRIDILVNNAGLFILRNSEAMPEEDWRIQIDVMLNGVFFMRLRSWPV